MVRVALIALALVACAQIELREVPMPCPEIQKEELPTLQAIPACDDPDRGEECVTDETWFTIERREMVFRHVIERYESVCDTFARLAEE